MAQGVGYRFLRIRVWVQVCRYKPIRLRLWDPYEVKSSICLVRGAWTYDLQTVNEGSV